MRVLFLALAGGPPEHISHQESQELTWAHNDDTSFRTIWMHGDSTLATPKLINHNLYLPVEERYDNLLAKTILGVNWAIENLEFDYLIRTNTSNYFYRPFVEQHLSRMSSSNFDAGGVVASWRGSIEGVKKSHNYISGAGIFLSKKACHVVVAMNAKEFSGIPDDVAIGNWLEKHQIGFADIPRNNITDFKPIWPSPQVRVKSWKYPQVTVQRMKEIHEIYSTQSDSNLEKKLIAFLKNEISRCELEKKKRKYLFRTQLFFAKGLILRAFNGATKKK